MPAYQRREPEHTLLYSLVARELPALRDALSAASPTGATLPRHVDKELEAYLRCGILAHGFARVACKKCRSEHLVAFSCKGRGICPSCIARRMADTAAHLVDRVLPHVPVRQWVATFSRRVRYHLADDPKLASAALREVLRVLFAFQRRRARRLGARPARAHSNGAITIVQRFNSALELSLHFHILIPDGIFLSDESDPDRRPRFLPIAPPTDEEIANLLAKIIRRVTALLKRAGRLEDEVDIDPQPHLLLAARTPPGLTRFVDQPLPPRCARRDGFSLHAGSAVHENDRAGLETLCRYGLRPPLSLSRMLQATDGTILFRMKRVFADGTHTLKFAPREFLLRLCALVPPRGFHMVRYAGLFSAHARGRRALTGRGMCDHQSPARSSAAPPAPPLGRPAPSTPSPAPAPRSSKQAVPPPNAIDPPSPLSGPPTPERPRRLDWAQLLKRTFAIDVQICRTCGGPAQIIAFIDDEPTARRILDHLGLPSRPPPRSTPRSSQSSLPFPDPTDPPFLVD